MGTRGIAATRPLSAGRRRRAPGLLGLAALSTVAVAACGGSAPTPTASATATSTHSGPATATATASPTPSGPAMLLVWVVRTPSDDQQIRIATPGGGPARTVITLAGTVSISVFAFSHGTAFVQQRDGSLELVNLESSATVTIPSVFPHVDSPGAVDDSGQHMEYSDLVPGGAESLMEVDLSSHAVTTVGSLGGNLAFGGFTPEVWHGTVISGTTLGTGEVDQVASGTGAILATTTLPAGYPVFVAPDGVHAAAAVHGNLGDASDCNPGTGAVGHPTPDNTLQSFAIGSLPTTFLSEAHHNLNVLGGSPGFSTLLIDDEPTLGAVPIGGAVPSPCDSYIEAGALYQDGATAAVAVRTGSGAELVQVAAGKAPIILDSVAAGWSPYTVSLVPAS